MIYFYPADCSATMAYLKQLLLSTPNLRKLSLDIHQLHSLSIEYGPMVDYCGLGFVDGEQMPPLEELTIRTYSFGHAAVSNGPLFSTRGYPITGTEIDFWAETFDWSQLKRLQTSNGELLLKIMPKLESLVDFAYLVGWLEYDISSFCLSIPAALRSICAPTLDSVTLEGILRHSSSLRELRIHRPETYEGGWRQRAVNLDTLHMIRSKCSFITDLDIDLARSGEWPHAIFDILASFSNLGRLKICVELGLSDAESLVGPPLTASAAEHIFTYIRSRSPDNRPSLQRLVIYPSPHPSIQQ